MKIVKKSKKICLFSGAKKSKVSDARNARNSYKKLRYLTTHSSLMFIVQEKIESVKVRPSVQHMNMLIKSYNSLFYLKIRKKNERSENLF